VPGVFKKDFFKKGIILRKLWGFEGDQNLEVVSFGNLRHWA
jgi:hypothetical protein